MKMMEIIFELLVLLGAPRDVAVKLGWAITAIADPVQRTTELAVAVAEIKAGKLPSILGGG